MWGDYKRMSLKFVLGDITKSDVDYICHQVNCQGVMGSGVAKAIKNKWPVVYTDYRRFYESNKPLLNEIQIVAVSTEQLVINMFSQEYYGYDGDQYTSYDAFWKCLNKIKNKVPKGSKIAFPSKIGCCRGGANWQVILTMISEVLESDYNVEIWEYDAG
jgi:O-acetyl-ADP-ribose deacetylase (regulator of RNase III)